MSGRILMATVAALALAAPAAAQDQVKPPGTEQETAQQLKSAEEPLPEESAAPTEAEQPPMAEEQPSGRSRATACRRRAAGR